MATELKTRPGTSYDADFYAWALEQAALLKERRFDDLDLDNLIEEVEDLAGTKLSRVLNNSRVVIEHLIKLQHSPASDPRNGWRRTVREHRRRVQTDLTPRLRQILESEIPRIHAAARDDAVAGMRDFGENAAADEVPADCPYGYDHVTGDWWP